MPKPQSLPGIIKSSIWKVESLSLNSESKLIHHWVGYQIRQQAPPVGSSRPAARFSPCSRSHSWPHFSGMFRSYPKAVPALPLSTCCRILLSTESDRTPPNYTGASQPHRMWFQIAILIKDIARESECDFSFGAGLQALPVACLMINPLRKSLRRLAAVVGRLSC